MNNRKILSILGVLLAVTMLFCACDNGGGNTKPSGNGSDPTSASTPSGLSDGTITYAAATCESIINVADSGTVALATASNGATVTYALKDSAEVEKLNNAFGGAISIAADGTITGSYNAVKKIKVMVTASAEKCAPVTVEITVSVVNPYLQYTGKQLIAAKQGLPYATSVALVEDEDAEVTYALAKGATLPAGLSLALDGTITGTPTTIGRGTPFKVNATARGFSTTEAEFTIDVVINRVSDTSSRIVNFGLETGAKELTDAFVDAPYVNETGVSGSAAALNENNITYTLTTGSQLPEGLTLYSNGVIIGTATTRGTYNFSVTASAAACESVTKEFTISVKPRRIRFESSNGELTKGEAANYSIATADAGEGVAITYTMSSTDAAKLKSEYGLEVTSAGVVTGTPTKVVELMSFKVTAEAEGFTSTTAVKYFRINEPLQAPAGGKFEAEYIDIMGKNGTGYSASPTGKDMIDTSFEGLNISNGAFVNYMHNDTITLEFVIYAEEAVSGAKLYIQMSSEMGNVNLTPSGFGVYTYAGKDTTGTKTTVNYGSVRVNGGEQKYVNFQEYQFGTVNLAKGWNVIQLAVHTNDYRGAGITGGPGIDYIRIETASSLKWVPCTYNLSR